MKCSVVIAAAVEAEFSKLIPCVHNVESDSVVVVEILKDDVTTLLQIRNDMLVCDGCNKRTGILDEGVQHKDGSFTSDHKLLRRIAVLELDMPFNGIVHHSHTGKNVKLRAGDEILIVDSVHGLMTLGEVDRRKNQMTIQERPCSMKRSCDSCFSVQMRKFIKS